MEKFAEKFPKIDQSQLLSDDQLDSIEGGACGSGCKQACLPGNMNGTVLTTPTPAEVEKVVDKVLDAADVAKPSTN
jgi:hypothetical protein